MPSPSLLQRLKERKLVQWAVAYLAGAWVIYEATGTALEAWDIPVLLVQSIHVLLVLGFLITLVLAWYHGEKGRQRVSGPELLMVAALLVVAGVAVTMLGRPAEEPEPAPVTAAPAAVQDEGPSIAVLPFDPLSAREEDAHFTDGLHDQIISQLTKINGLSVRGRTSVLVYRDSPKNNTQIGEELNARYIVEGTVLRAGGTVRITVQLIEAAKDEHIWSDTYDRAMSVENLLSIQTEIVSTVTDSVRAVVTPEELSRISLLPTDNSEAYDLYVRGVGRWETGMASSTMYEVESFHQAVDLLQEAVGLDPDFGLAYAKLCHYHLGLWWYGLDRNRDRVESARQALEQAVNLAPDLGETLFVQGLFRYWAERDYDGALEALEAARQRFPGDPDPPEFIGFVKRRQGRFLESARIHEVLFLLNPRNADLAHNLSMTFGAMRQNEESAEWAERAMELGYGSLAAQDAAYAHLRMGNVDQARATFSSSPDSIDANVVQTGFWIEAYARDFDAAASWLGRAPAPFFDTQFTRLPVSLYRARLHQWTGRSEQAREAFSQALQELEDIGWEGGSRAVAYAGLGDRDAALAQIEAETAERRSEPDLFDQTIPFKEMALVQVLLGEHDAAINILTELMTMEYNAALTVVDLRLDPTWDPLRDHPRFQALLEEYADDVGR